MPPSASETHIIIKAIDTLGIALNKRLDDQDERMSEVEKSLSKVINQQAEDKGRDVNPRLHDHEMRMRKVEHFTSKVVGIGSALGFCAGFIGSKISFLFK